MHEFFFIKCYTFRESQVHKRPLFKALERWYERIQLKKKKKRSIKAGGIWVSHDRGESFRHLCAFIGADNSQVLQGEQVGPKDRG